MKKKRTILISKAIIDQKLKLLNVRERVSTANSLISTLVRWGMSDRMFGNDPDVMILRNQKNKLKPDERYTLCVLNNILGALVFSSDNVGLYGEDEHTLYSATFPKVVSYVESVLEYYHNSFVVEFVVDVGNGHPRLYSTFSNLTSDDQTIYLPPSSPQNHLFFATDNDIHMSGFNGQDRKLFYHPSSAVKLKQHETKTFLHIPIAQEDHQLNLLGSFSHIVPGAELSQFEQTSSGDINIHFNEHNTRSHKALIGYGPYLYQKRPNQLPTCTINGKDARAEWFPVHGVGEGRPKSEVLAFILE
jgi:hypothetical protein